MLTMMDLVRYSSPQNEESFFKGIPMSEYTKENMKIFAKVLALPVKVRFRGPRHDPMRLTCLKKDASTFSVYKRG